MATETSSRNSSLSLHEILEAEFIALHGALPSDYPTSDDRETRLRALWAAVHKLGEKRSAFCLSGGGIRSAIFGLGILQGLARCGLLDKFDYLSTVSGGGYIGSWLSAWIRNDPGGIQNVINQLKSRPDSGLLPEPRPIRHLREFSNYLAPKSGLTSVDFWTLITTFIRNMFLNWLVLISWLAAAMMIPRLYLGAMLLPPSGWDTSPDYARTMHSYDVALSILLVIAVVLIATAMAYAIIDVPSTGNARLSQRRFLKYRQLPLLVASLIVAAWWAIFRNIHGSEPFPAGIWLFRFILFTTACYLSGGALAAILRLFRRQAPRPDRFVHSVLRFGTILLTAAFAGVCLWIIATKMFFAPASNALNYVCFAPALILAVLLLVNFLFTGLASWVTEDEDREWWGRSAAWLLITIIGWIVVNAIVLWGAQAITATTTGNHLEVFLGQLKANPVAKGLLGAFGGITGISGALLAIRTKLGKSLGQKAGFQATLLAVAIVFFILLSMVISWILLLLGSLSSVQNPNDWLAQLFLVCFLTGGTLLFGLVMGLFINANKFSLHATYRNRLIRAFLAASRTQRNPHLFTGFDPEDNIALHELSAARPLHVINGALNLVKGEQLAWQERRAESFTMSRLHCGSFQIGYRPSLDYGNEITLGTALAISGAAANPNMGYHSSPVLGLLMTLFNVRLGWWLGNPGPAGDKTWRRSGPQYSVGPLFSEAAGNTTDRYKYVNLSDGGHFENLALYEMVLRRCHYIVVSDGGEDPECSFADLGEAVRKIRIDFGIPIDFGPMSIYPRSAIETLKAPGHHCAVGRICYSVVDGPEAPDGVIVYIKPVCYGDEPRDIYEYFKRNITFPHESTSDQFFSESQFESYRMLGAYTMDKLCSDCHGDFRLFVGGILRDHLQIEPPSWLVTLLQRSPAAAQQATN
jgi:patatin-like phospholipase